jgi:hypothetical protein
MSYLPRMENLSEKVYECTLALEAQMICDLLARAGISARVDGEFLAGVAGEIPLGSAVKVRVAPDRAAEARDVISEWEKIQPPPDSTPPPPRAGWLSPLWFGTGLIVGGLAALWLLRTPASTNGVDYDGDGDFEITYFYAGQDVTRTEIDRDNDGRSDGRWHVGFSGADERFEADDDFDGKFETQVELDRGDWKLARIDRNDDGKPDEIQNYRNGIIVSAHILDPDSGRLVARETYENGERSAAELDRDGDGTFEQRMEFDRFDLPR